MKRIFFSIFALIIASNPSNAVVNGKAGKTSKGKIDITLVIPPKPEKEKQIIKTNKEKYLIEVIKL